MSTRDALAAVGATSAPNGAAVRAVEAVTGWLEKRTSRRGFLIRAGVVGSALAVDPSGYVLKPGTAYASVCGPGASCTSGWTVFCATINHGSNSCPPGSIAAGWWKADGASLCGGKARYIVDCNATCHCTNSRANAKSFPKAASVSFRNSPSYTSSHCRSYSSTRKTEHPPAIRVHC